jgi:hypothetical protein
VAASVTAKASTNAPKPSRARRKSNIDSNPLFSAKPEPREPQLR